MRMFVLISAMVAAFAHGLAQEELEREECCADSVRCYCLKQEIVIEGAQGAGRSTAGISRTLTSTDDALRDADGVDFTRRANFASEPTIRGMSGGQLSVTIDGMKMVCACVDKMDPVTAYVEVENLSRLEVVKGGADLSHAQTIGGSINLVTARPLPDEPMHGKIESGYESAPQLWFVRGNGSTSTGPLGFRGSASIKRAGDFRAGADMRIPRSGYSKENYKVDATLKIDDNHLLSASCLADNARDIGYPALIMDTRKTEAYLLSVEHVWQHVAPNIQSLSTRAYMNRVLHWMDDSGRSRDEIDSRAIMPSMNMPMFGETRVIGVQSEARYADTDQSAKVNAEVHQLRAFADMNMLSLKSGIAPMHLVNVGDARLTTVGIAAEYVRQVSPVAFLGAAGRCDYSGRDLLDQTARSALSIYWNGAASRVSYLAASASVSLELRPTSGMSVRWTGSRSQRLPTHIENYGYFLYNPMDNSIYVGNPQLATERSWQTDLTLSWSSRTSSASASLYYVGIENYIAGHTIIPGDPANLQFPQAFRQFDNIGRARIYGAELSGSMGLISHLELRAMIRAQHGQLLSLDEPLPLMPPLTGRLVLRAFWDNSWIEAVARVTGDQSRVSRSILPEDPTAGCALIDLRAGFTVNRRIDLQCGVENVLDRLFHEHTSINNLPGLGRNVYLSLGIGL